MNTASSLGRDGGPPGPVPWSLAWDASGELAPQDRFDVLQTLIASETAAVQAVLVRSVEQMATSELSVMASVEVTELCA